MRWALRAWMLTMFLVASFCIHYAVERDRVGWLAVVAMLCAATGGSLITVDVFLREERS